MVTDATSLNGQARRDPPEESRVSRAGGLRVPEQHAVLLSLTLAAIVFAVDLTLPLGVASAIPYTFAVLVALKAPARGFAPGLALVCCVLTIVKVIVLPERGSTELWKVVANRLLALFAIGMTAFLGMKRRRADERRQAAEEQTRLHLSDLAHMGRLQTAGQLAAALAHELNQPLAAVSLQAEIATHLIHKPEARNTEILGAALAEITEQSQRAAAIVRALRAMVQKAEPKQTPVDVNDIVQQVERLMATQAKRAGVRLELCLSPTPPVLGDRIQLEQVLLNLVQNALEAVQAADAPPRLVQVEAKPEADCVMVAVCDSGVGLAAAEVERVFERFYTTKPTGMGMGLGISRSIIEAHGGRLWAAPNPTRGATFTFTLPILRSA